MILDMLEKAKSGISLPVVGLAAVLCSVVGLQLGGLATTLLDDGGSMTVALVAMGLVGATGGVAVGFWLCSVQDAGSGES